MATSDILVIVWLSVRVAVLATLVVLPIALGIAWLLARRSFIGRGLVEALVYLPLVLPPVVTGYALLMVLGARSPLGLSLAFTTTAAVIAAATMALPLMVRSMRVAIEQVDRRLEQAAASCGAPPWRVWWTVTLPLSLPGISAGLILGFARALGEFGATIVVAGNIPEVSRTLPLAIYTALQRPGGDAAAWQLVMVAVVLSVAAIVVSEWLIRRQGKRVGLSS